MDLIINYFLNYSLINILHTNITINQDKYLSFIKHMLRKKTYVSRHAIHLCTYRCTRWLHLKAYRIMLSVEMYDLLTSRFALDIVNQVILIKILCCRIWCCIRSIENTKLTAFHTTVSVCNIQSLLRLKRTNFALSILSR